jgi:1-deoxy-D-xylulose-5-phosphate synthase
MTILDDTTYPLLSQINSPVDLRELAEQQLTDLATELRQHLIESLNQCGGHFGANLGSVELTIALHYLYNTPIDKIVWDVGHQAYPHKILTGRKERLHTIRQTTGLNPFPKRSESEYDTFGTGHSSTSISAALGMAMHNKIEQNNNRVVAVIGDGGLTGGMAFEALNHGGALDPNMLIILNDNEMSISENVGALTQYFGRILAGNFYCTLRENSKKVLAKMPGSFSRIVKRTETQLKGMIQPGTFFEELGFNYFGPIDGHDLPTLICTIRNIQQLDGAKILHINTVKGKGYPAAEAEPIRYHAVKPGFNNKKEKNKAASAPTYSNIFGQWLCDMAAEDNKLVAITPAMREGSDLIKFSQKYPQRYFDVGIAEQHSVTFAAGLACEGKKPVVAIYSTFLQRAYDQLIHDVAIQNLDVTFAIDRAGVVGPDGATHAGSFDLSYLRCIPNMIIMAPINENECRQMLTTAYQHPGPAAVRYPRGTGPGISVSNKLSSINIGEADISRQGKEIAILAFGTVHQAALEAAEEINATVINMRFIKPLDQQALIHACQQHKLIVTIEDNAKQGGAGSAVLEAMQELNLHNKVLRLGLEDRFLNHASRDELLAQSSIDTYGIQTAIKKYIDKIKNKDIVIKK